MENEEVKYTYEDVVQIPEQLEAVIIGVKLVKAGEIFKDKAKEPEKDTIIFQIENKEFGVMSYIPVNYFENGKVPDHSKIGKILERYTKRYGKDWVLGVGSKIDIERNDKGFWEIKK